MIHNCNTFGGTTYNIDMVFYPICALLLLMLWVFGLWCISRVGSASVCDLCGGIHPRMK
jgi:hypothetical protein